MSYEGQYIGKIDAKGRLVLPARIKARLPVSGSSPAPEVILSFGVEPCVLLYPQEKYEILCAHYNQLSEFDPLHRKLRRSFFRNIISVPLDGLGRVLLPKRYLTYANLDREGAVVGVGEHVEIWNPETLNKYLTVDEQEHATLLKTSMGELKNEMKDG